jgi:hypothetical protein
MRSADWLELERIAAWAKHRGAVRNGLIGLDVIKIHILTIPAFALCLIFSLLLFWRRRLPRVELESFLRQGAFALTVRIGRGRKFVISWNGNFASANLIRY